MDAMPVPQPCEAERIKQRLFLYFGVLPD